MIKIRCVVERITYQNAENGYSVLKCAVKGYNDLVTVVGNLLDANVGSVLLIDGDWKVDRKYGQQFIAEKWEETLPATVYGLEKYLGSGLIKGVGPKFAKRIVQMFGTDTISVIEEEPNRLLEVEGIGGKRVAKIIASWEKQKEVKNIMLFLQAHDVSTAFAAKIYTAYGNDAIQTVKENPYKLADDIWGIGFKTADQIAAKLGFSKDCFVRCRSGLMYTLSQLADSGDTYSDRAKLLKTASELLEVEEPTLSMTLDHMIHEEDVKLDRKQMQPAANTLHDPSAEQDLVASYLGEDALPVAEPVEDPVYLPPFYFAEVGVANRLRKLRNTPTQVIHVDMAAIEKATGMQYDEVQA